MVVRNAKHDILNDDGEPTMFWNWVPDLDTQQEIQISIQELIVKGR